MLQWVLSVLSRVCCSGMSRVCCPADGSRSCRCSGCCLSAGCQTGVAQNTALKCYYWPTDMPTFVEPHAEPFLEFRQLIQREWTCRGVLNFCDREVLDLLIRLKMLKTIHYTHHKSIAYHSTLAVSEASFIDNNYCIFVLCIPCACSFVMWASFGRRLSTCRV